MAEIRIGTSGYSYNEWVGPVYPEGSKPDQYLALYSGLFPTVELNFSYYKMPEARNLAKMLIDGGRNLTFALKAHKTLTHEINPAQWEEEAKTFITAIEPLLEEKRLEAVLFQFPYSFQYTPDNRVYLDRLLKFFHGIPVAVEFRKADWYSGRVIDSMKERNVPLVSLDMPELPKLPPQMDVVTAPLAYIRLHGRNKEAWWGNDDQEGNLHSSAMNSVEVYARYDYLYTDNEIEAWAERIERITEQAHRILVYFNNHVFGKAVRNAQTLERKLGMRKEKLEMRNEE